MFILIIIKDVNPLTAGPDDIRDFFHVWRVYIGVTGW